MERIGRYVIFEAIGTGGTATVHLAQLTGPMGFSRTLAVKRLHRFIATDSDVAVMLLDEARLSSRIRSPFVVPTLDVVAAEGELLIAMEYVLGESLSTLVRSPDEPTGLVPCAPALACAIVSNLLHGLQAAHELRDDAGTRLGIVHRDVSPQNVIVGADGIARLADFGVAKALGQMQVTREGAIKGKLAYMAPEQVRGEALDQRADLFAAGVVLWELLTGRRLFKGDTQEQTMARVLACETQAPSVFAPEVPASVNDVVMRALAPDRAARFSDASSMADALEGAIRCAPPSAVATWVAQRMGSTLDERRRRVAALDAAAAAEVTPASSAAAASESTGSAQSIYERSISVSVPEGDPPAAPASRRPKRGHTAVLIVFSAAAVLAGTLATMFGLGRSGAGAEQVDGAPVGAAVVAPESVDAADATSAAAIETRTAALVDASVEAGDLARDAAALPARSHVRKVVAPDCTNPYYSGPSGQRLYRRECLRR